MYAEQQKLMGLLRSDVIQQEKVYEAVERLNELQSAMRRSVIERILEELSYLPPEDREIYLAGIERRMMMDRMSCRRPGRGRGMRRDEYGRDPGFKRDRGGRKMMPGGGEGSGFRDGFGNSP